MLLANEKSLKFHNELSRLPFGRAIAQTTIPPEQNQTYLLSFKYYREDLCEIDLLEKNRPKECIQVLKRASQAKVGSLKECNVDRIRVNGSGAYKKLFYRIPEDTELFEHKVQGTSRIFYFTAMHYFYVVAITNNHYETDKIR